MEGEALGFGEGEDGVAETLTIRTDLSQWKLTDGWLPGEYEITMRVDNLIVDSYSRLSTLTDPVRFKIR